MLTSIQICDFAVIEHLDLDLQKGLTVLSGETGTGKSILVDALGLVLGDRADSSIVRHGCPRTEISATFDLARSPQAMQWLIDHELDAGDAECLLRRTISAGGGSRAYINGRTATLQQLRHLGDLLVDIHGQHEHQTLVKRDQQRRLLDDFAGHARLTEQVRKSFLCWQSLNREYNELRQASVDRDRHLELLRFQVQELVALDITAAEIPQLEQAQRRLAHADRLITTCQQSLNRLYDDEQSIDALLSRLLTELQDCQQHDPALTPVIDMLNSAGIQIQEATAELRHHADLLETDPAQLQEIEQRLAAIHDTARKHHVQAEELPALTERLSRELDTLQHADLRLTELQQQISLAADEYRRAADKLSASRRRSAGKLDLQVSQSMQRLGMPDGRFITRIEACEDFTAQGLERIEFMIQTNPGQPAQALAKIASGGELSRISLAIQVITADQSAVPTLIFDEVDVGIGGSIAEIVGQLLRKLGKSRQVLCVTHLPQVAAQGHHHLRVSKSSSAQKTTTVVDVLDIQHRRDEIARMLGGVEITEQTKAHAEEMIARASQGGEKRGKSKEKSTA